jgi:hypothetical protein
MDLPDLVARLQSFKQVTQGLASETGGWKEEREPLLAAESRTYVNGILDALAGLDEARVALVQACWRIERERRSR